MANNLTSSLLKMGNKKKTDKSKIPGTTSSVAPVEFGSVKNGRILTPSQSKAESKLSAGAISGRQELRDRSKATAVAPSASGLTPGATAGIEQLKNREETPKVEVPKPTDTVTDVVESKTTEAPSPTAPAPSPTETALEGMKNMGATGGVVDKSSEDTTGAIEGQINASAGLPGVFGAQDLIAQNQELLSENIANNTFDAKERNVRNKLISSLNQTTIGQAALAAGGTLAQLTTQQLEDLVASEGFELSDKIKERIKSEGKSLIETENIRKIQNYAQNQYSSKQLEREFGRAITDREDFNAQQDSRLRRMAAAFGGGAASSLSNNVAVMREQEKGMSILEDLRGQYVDKQSLLSTQAMGIMDTWSNNVSAIQSKSSALVEDKYAAIANTIDDLISQGVTNKEDLNAAVLQAKQDYWKTYADVSEKAQTFISKENQQLTDNQLKLDKLNQDRDKVLTENSDFIYMDGKPVMEKSTSKTLTGNDISLLEMGLMQDAEGNLTKIPQELADHILKFTGEDDDDFGFGDFGGFGGGNASIPQTGYTENIDITRTGTNVAVDTLNPGNITADSIPEGFTKEEYAREIGATGTYTSPNGREYFVFPNAEAGAGALERDLKAKQTGQTQTALNANSTLSEFTKIYTGDENPNYAQVLANTAGVDINSPIGSIDTKLLAKGVMEAEGFTRGIAEREFTPETDDDALVEQFRSGVIDSIELGRQGFSEGKIRAIAKRARQLDKQFPSAISQLTPAEVLQTKDLSVQIFGKRAGAKIENIDTIAKLKAQGMSNDDIQDELRKEGFGSEFTGRIKSTFARLSQKGFTGDQVTANREELEDLASEFGGDSFEVKEYLIGLADAKADTVTQQQVGGRIDALENLRSIDENLKAYVEKNGDTGLLSGSLEKIQENVLKSTDNPELAGIANEIALSIIAYRKAVSGAAFTESEAKEYNKVFPDISKSPELNQAVIDSLTSVFERNNDSFYSRSMSRSNFNELFPNGTTPVIFGETQAQPELPTQAQQQAPTPVTISGAEAQSIRDKIQELERAGDTAGLEELESELSSVQFTVSDTI